MEMSDNFDSAKIKGNYVSLGGSGESHILVFWKSLNIYKMVLEKV